MCIAFLISFVSLCWSLLLEKGIGKDNRRNMLRLEDKPGTYLGQYKDIVRITKRTNEDKPRTSRGPKNDLQRAAPTESTTLPVYLLQKTALRIILKVPPRCHVTSQFEILKIMPIKMFLKYRHYIWFAHHLVQLFQIDVKNFLILDRSWMLYRQNLAIGEGKDLCWLNVYAFTTSILWERRPQYLLAFRGGWPVPCGGPGHSPREPGTVWVCVRLGVESVTINQVAAILFSDVKATLLLLFLFLVTFLFENPLYRNWKRKET